MNKDNFSIKETFNLAIQHHQKKDLKVAEKLYEEVLKSNPNHAISHNNLGVVFKELRKHQKAKDCYKKAIEIDSNYADPHNNLGMAYQEMGEVQEAKSCYEKAIQINPNYASAHGNLGNILKKLRQHKKALSCYEKAIQISPDYANAHYNLGIILKELGQSQKAIISYQKVIEIHSNHVDAHNNLGTIFQEMREHQKAKSCYTKAIQINPNHAIAHNNLGILFHNMGEHQKARSCYEKAIKINPKTENIHYNLGKTFEKTKEYQKAISCYQKENLARSRVAVLECTYLSNGIVAYNKILKQFIDEDPCNIGIAAFAVYVEKKEGIKNIYPFCKNPMDFVFIKNLKNEFTNSKEFSKNLLQILEKIESTWEPFGSNVKGGSRTLGLSFDKNDFEIVEFKKLIEKQIEIYRKKYKHKEDYFITKWPPNSSIIPWHNKLAKQGYLTPHIHPGGWLSGVFYLSVPKLLNKNEGSIKLSLFGSKYPDDKNLIHSPRDFDIILFPSSLYHQTIPFDSQDERHSIAFDVVKKI